MEGKYNYLCINILISGFFGIGITISSILTVILYGPFAINFAGVLGHIILTFIGLIYFKDVEPSLNLYIGLSLSFLGAIYFSYTKYK